VTQREASTRCPDVIVLINQGADEEKISDLIRGVIRTTARVAVAATLGGAAGVSFALGQSLVGPPPLPSPSPLPFPAEVPSYRGEYVPKVPGRRRGLATGAKIGVPVAAAALTAALWSAIPRPPPPELAGSWQVGDFVLSQNSGVNSSVNLAGGRMVFVPEAGCRGELCPLVVSEGPPLLRGVVLKPQGGGGRYVGAPVNVTRSCGGAEVPQDRMRSSLTATRGEGGDFRFVITVEMPEAWQSCPPATTRYDATARRTALP
jgi:hypothetical protein